MTHLASKGRLGFTMQINVHRNSQGKLLEGMGCGIH